MTKKELKMLHELSEKLFALELRKSRMSVMPYAWTRRADGQIVVVAAFKSDADKIEKLLKANFA